jgi:large subunit ribosomal protein L5
MNQQQSTKIKKKWSHPMQIPYIQKVVVNIGVGQGGEELQKAIEVLKTLTDQKPVIIKAKKNIKEWKVRKGQSIATKVTLRGKKAEDFIKKSLVVYDNRILRKSFDDFGNVSWGVDEHIKVPGVKYNPEVGIFGFNVSVRLIRAGFRVKKRKRKRQKIHPEHYVRKAEAMYFFEKKYNVEIVDKMETRFY